LKNCYDFDLKRIPNIDSNRSKLILEHKNDNNLTYEKLKNILGLDDNGLELLKEYTIIEPWRTYTILNTSFTNK